MEPLNIYWDTALGLYIAMNKGTSRSEDSRKFMKLYRSRTSKLCELHTNISQAPKEDGEFEKVLACR